MRRPLCLTWAVVALGFSTTLHAGVITFDFESDSAGTPTPLSDTVSGLVAHFSSSGDPGAFQITTASPGFFNLLSGNYLSDAPNANLTIQFSAPQDMIVLDFATPNDGVTLSLSALNGAAQVGSSSANAAMPPGNFIPEGTIGFGGVLFDSVVLSMSGGGMFAIDNVSVGLPEPGTLLLSAAVLAAFGIRSRVQQK